jgi:hypothetical protein
MAENRIINLGTGNYNENIVGNYIQGNYYAGDHQTLAESAKEIQDLLQQLERDNPGATDSQQENFVNEKIAPTNKERLLSAVKEGGTAIIEECFDSPYIRIAKKLIDGWQKA